MLKLYVKEWEEKSERTDKMAKCITCGIELTDATNYNGWCQKHFIEEDRKYKRMCLEQDGIAEGMLSNSEIDMLPE